VSSRSGESKGKNISDHLTTPHRLWHLVRSCVADLLTLGGLRFFLLYHHQMRPDSFGISAAAALLINQQLLEMPQLLC